MVRTFTTTGWSDGGSSGDASTNTTVSVVNEIPQFADTGGKLFKRSTLTGLLKAAAGVLSTAVSGTDYAPATSGSSALKANAGGFGTATINDLGAQTADYSANSHKIISLTDGSADSDACTYGQAKAFSNGLDDKGSVRVATTGAETFTISGGAVTQISGTTVDGVSLAVNDRILVKNAPASTGAGVADDNNATGSSQPANGIYVVTGNTTNLSVSRASDADANAEVTAGLTVFVSEGNTPNVDTRWTLVTDDPITLNTTALKFTQTDRSALAFSGGLTKTGKTVKRDDLTGDVTTTGNGNATTIAGHAVSYAKMQQVAANKVLGNSGGSTADVAEIALAATATASAIGLRDANANIAHNNMIPGYTEITSAAGTTTLTIASTQVQVVTGTADQTIKLPTTSVGQGHPQIILSKTTGNVTVQSSAANTIVVLKPGMWAIFVSRQATPTADTHWYALISPGVAGDPVFLHSLQNAWAVGQMGVPGYIDRKRRFSKIRYVPSVTGTGTFTVELRDINTGTTFSGTSATSTASAKYVEISGTFDFAAGDMPYAYMTAVSGTAGLNCDVWLIP